MEHSHAMETGYKIELIITLCHKLAEVLKDPTNGGQIELSAERRTQSREEAHDELLNCIDVLASCAQFNHGFFDVINIANKYKVAVQQ